MTQQDSHQELHKGAVQFKGKRTKQNLQRNHTKLLKNNPRFIFSFYYGFALTRALNSAAAVKLCMIILDSIVSQLSSSNKNA